VEWFKSQGCKEVKIPVPKGGMVLWDSRLIHDNVKPEAGRPHTDRWRFAVFSCMTPAIWARPQDLSTKREAYESLEMTSHYPSTGVRTFRERNFSAPGKTAAVRMPAIAKTPEARLLVGLDSYDFADGKSNGPKWTPRVREDARELMDIW
jgi:hypothetical protein